VSFCRRWVFAAALANGGWWLASLQTACIAWETPAPQQGKENPMKPNENLMAALLRVRNGELSLPEGRSVVQRAGASKDPAYIPVLKEIVARAAPTNRHLIAFDAMHALSLSGESAAYFLGLARAHASNKMASYYAILILARDPDPQILSALQSDLEASDDNQIRGAVDLARYVAHRNQQLQTIQGFEKQAGFLIENLRTGWNSIQVEEYSPTANLGPVAVWSQRRIRALSELHPREVAEAVSKIGPSSDLGPSWPSFKAYVSRFISDAARAQVQAMPQ
jgi:hypothetical protein